jgi:hypothetical protein
MQVSRETGSDIHRPTLTSFRGNWTAGIPRADKPLEVREVCKKPGAFEPLLLHLGREVLQISARKGPDSLAAHRHRANDLSAVLAVAGVEIASKDLVYCALSVYGVRDV